MPLSQFSEDHRVATLKTDVLNALRRHWLVLLLLAVLVSLGLTWFAGLVQRSIHRDAWADAVSSARLLPAPDIQETLTIAQQRLMQGAGMAFSSGDALPEHTAGHYWLQLSVPSVSHQRKVVLTLPSRGVDRIDFYWQKTPDAWHQASAGMQIPVSQWRLPHLYPAFDFVLHPHTQPQYVYLRLEASSLTEISWDLWDQSTFLDTNQKWHMLLGGYMGVLVLTVCISCGTALLWRRSVSLYYVVSEILLGLALMALFGLGGEMLWPHSAWWNAHASQCLSLFAMASIFWFHNRFMQGISSTWELRTQLLFSALALLLPLLLLVDQKVFLIVSKIYYAAAFFFMIATIALFARKQPKCGWWLFWGNVAVLMGTLSPTLLSPGPVTLSPALQQVMLACVCLGILLTLQAIYAQFRMIRDQEVQQHALLRTDPLTGLTREWLVQERLEHLIQRQQRSPGLGAVLRVRISNLRQIYDQDGPQFSEAASLYAGRCVATQGKRSGDTLGRLGDGDFVLILEGEVKPEFVHRCAQRIIAHGLNLSPWLPAGMTVKLRVATSCGLYPDIEATALLEKLAHALDQMDRSPPGQGRAIQALQSVVVQQYTNA